MTLRTKTLTAVAALSIFATGFAVAQDAEPTVDEAAEAQAATDQAAEGEAATDEEVNAEEAPAEEGTTEEADAASDAPAEEEAAADAQPTEDANAEAEAPAEEASSEDGAAEEAEAATEAPAEEGATEATDAASDAPAEEEAAADEQPTEDANAEAEAPAEEASSEEGAAEEAEAATDAPAEEGTTEEADGHGGGHIEDIAFSFEGPFGKFDQFQLQRGLQVYTEVCAACHGLKFVPIRTLHDEGGPGLPEDQVRAYAANFTVVDKETGEERPGLPTDHFPANTSAGAPDLSLMAKARAGFHGPYGTGLSQLFNGIGGPEYIHAILTSYTGEEIEQAGTVLYGNSAFSTGAIGMLPPLSDDLVTYEDGTPATVDQMARDVSAFLMWTAEPKMMDRQQVGFVSVLFLIVLSVLLYLTNKRLWAPHKGKNLDS